MYNSANQSFPLSPMGRISPTFAKIILSLPQATLSRRLQKIWVCGVWVGPGSRLYPTPSLSLKLLPGLPERGRSGHGRCSQAGAPGHALPSNTALPGPSTGVGASAYPDAERASCLALAKCRSLIKRSLTWFHWPFPCRESTCKACRERPEAPEHECTFLPAPLGHLHA